MTTRPGCVFCGIVAGTERAEVLNRIGDVVIFTPLNPVVDGHVLVVPTDHYATPDENPLGFATMASYAAMWALGGRGRGVTDYNLIISAGEAATQSITHAHLHYVPRVPGDGLTLPWTGQRR